MQTSCVPHSKTYIAIDLKSFYTSVECVERGLNPLTTDLVVADVSRTEKTICLAVSPSLKSYGLPGRARLFEVVQRLREVNNKRKEELLEGSFTGKSSYAIDLEQHKAWEVDYITAVPRMAHSIQHSVKIYSIYLRYVALGDIHVYSIDEEFIDATLYLYSSKLSTHDFAMKIIRDVLRETGKQLQQV